MSWIFNSRVQINWCHASLDPCQFSVSQKIDIVGPFVLSGFSFVMSCPVGRYFLFHYFIGYRGEMWHTAIAWHCLHQRSIYGAELFAVKTQQGYPKILSQIYCRTDATFCWLRFKPSEHVIFQSQLNSTDLSALILHLAP